MAKKGSTICLKTLSFLFLLSAGVYSAQAKEIPNLLSAVKAANPGDCIVLPSGKRYVLTEEEIDIVNNRFDYGDLSGVGTETLGDGTEIKTISEAHTAYIYPDGQSTHMLRTAVSFTDFMRQYIEKKYFLGRYVDSSGGYYDSGPNGSPKFYVFRASVQFQKISDGVDEAEAVIITAYNYKGENFVMRYFSSEGWLWGNVTGNWSSVGESHQLEFDAE